MRSTADSAPGTFSSHLNRYLAHLVEAAGGDKSGRWLEAATHGARKKDYWKNLTDDVRVMNTNDIQILAIAFDVTPFEFVADARRWKPASAPVSLDERRRVRAPKQTEPAAAKKKSRDRGEEPETT